MNPELRPAWSSDFEFGFDVKRQALGPYVDSRWGWDEEVQRKMHQDRWRYRTWYILELDGKRVGTVAITRMEQFIRFGEFYVLPTFQRQGLGTAVLTRVLADADAAHLPVRLECLKWNPAASLYKRHGFRLFSENETHSFFERAAVSG